MSQRYAPIAHHDDDDRDSIGSRPSSPYNTSSYDTPSHTSDAAARPYIHHQASHTGPSSPPPSFDSRTSSPHRSHGGNRRSTTDSDPLVSDADRNLNDAFDNPSDSESDDGSPTDHRLDDRQRVMSGRPAAGMDTAAGQDHDRPDVERRVTQLPVFAPATAPRRYGGPGNDGVFANLSAKPERGGGGDAEEKPPVSHYHPCQNQPHQLTIPRPTNKQPPTRHHPTGKTLSSHPRATFPTPTASTSTVSPSAPSSPSFGTA